MALHAYTTGSLCKLDFYRNNSLLHPMKEGQRLWTREELILAINLYCKLPFGRLHQRNPEVVQLAKLIHRTPGSVAYKLVNFASLDPSLQQRGIKGAVNASNLDKEIWNEFYNNWESAAYESEQLLAKSENTTVERLNAIPEEELPREGKERERLVKQRVNQCFFRKMILASYNNSCCITGIQLPQLLVASHISRWADDPENRMNPCNGLAMNALHDRAFEAGLIGITPDYCVVLSSTLKVSKDDSIEQLFLPYEGKQLRLPSRFLPDLHLLEHHTLNRFLGE
jgi:putative restriction endonuclease